MNKKINILRAILIILLLINIIFYKYAFLGVYIYKYKLFTIKKAYHKVGLNIYISSIIYSRYFLHPEEIYFIL